MILATLGQIHRTRTNCAGRASVSSNHFPRRHRALDWSLLLIRMTHTMPQGVGLHYTTVLLPSDLHNAMQLSYNSIQGGIHTQRGSPSVCLARGR